MTLHQFTIFTAIAKHGNLTRASQELRITQPCVSQQMRLLQEHYGARLFERRARGIELTSAGRRFLTAVSPILEQVRKLKTSFNQSVTASELNPLAVGGTYSSSTILLPSLLSRFRKSHSETEINFRTNNGSEIERLLLKENIEIAMTTSSSKWPRIIAESHKHFAGSHTGSRSDPYQRGGYTGS